MAVPALMLASSMTNLRNPHAALLALLPMAFALAGAWADERMHSGFTGWRSACRALGLTFTSLFTFTVELLPTAIAGALIGGIVLLIAGAALRSRDGARVTLAAHAGCALAMAAGLLVCAWLPSIPLMLGVEATLAAGTALLLCRHGQMRTRAHSRVADHGRQFSSSTGGTPA